MITNAELLEAILRLNPAPTEGVLVLCLTPNEQGANLRWQAKNIDIDKAPALLRTLARLIASGETEETVLQ